MANELTPESFVDHFNEFAENTQTARQLAERDRDYFDHNQLTAAERSTLKRRGQPPVIYNRIQPKITFMQGQELLSRTDPKAYPRTPKHEEAAEPITDALRYVGDNTDFNITASDCFKDYVIEGVEGVIVEIDPKTKTIEGNYIPFDRLYWDIHSRRNDFKDSRRFGIVLWKDLPEAVEMFPGKQEAIESMVSSEVEYETYEDKPEHKLWVDPSRKRVMILQEYFIHQGVWHEVFFCKGVFLQEPKPSPYLDADGNPECPIKLRSCFSDREGNRYGVVRAYIDAQDEINKRRSKAIHILNSNQTVAEEGVVQDINVFKAEKNKPDGHMTVTAGSLRDGRFQFVDQNSELMAHLQFMQEAKAEIDAVGANAALTGKQDGSPSGRALMARQQGGLVELGPVYDGHKAWKTEVYRAFWARIKQFWTEEKWIRVTDREDSFKFVGLNQKVTVLDAMKEHAKQTGEQIPPQLAADPRAQQVLEVRNQVAEIDVDIIIDQSPDTVTLQGETLEMFSNAVAASGQQVPLEVWLELMPNMHNKKMIRDMLKGDPEQQQAQAQQAQMQQQIQMAGIQGELESKAAETENKRADTQQKMVNAAKTQAETEKTQQESIQRALENLGMRKYDPEPKVTI